MGTNYYAEDDATCNNPAHTETLHIGKSSGGWKFGFHGIPDREPPLTSWAAWKEFLTNRKIADEYGREVEPQDFFGVVENRAPGAMCRVEPDAKTRAFGFGGRFDPTNGNYHDAEGFDFYDGEFC